MLLIFSKVMYISCVLPIQPMYFINNYVNRTTTKFLITKIFPFSCKAIRNFRKHNLNFQKTGFFICIYMYIYACIYIHMCVCVLYTYALHSSVIKSFDMIVTKKVMIFRYITNRVFFAMDIPYVFTVT
jgi:hypothetical protein